MPDDDRGRTHAACCATCRWWHALGDGWGECARPDDRCADALCTTLVPPALIRVVVRQGPACGEGCCDAALHTEGRFGCRVWEPRRDSGPQDAPGSARGCETPGRGLPSRGGPFPAARAGVLEWEGDAELPGRDRDLLRADFAAVLADLAAAKGGGEG